jgi:hypothetical protein
MTIRDIAAVDRRLAEWKFFEECLVHDVRPIKFGFGLDLVVNHVWSDGGAVRPDVLEVPRLVTLRLLGLESLQFTGALTASMRRDPDAINWGLTEISRIVTITGLPSLGLSVEWEGDRQLTAQFMEMEFIVPD